MNAARKQFSLVVAAVICLGIGQGAYAAIIGISSTTDDLVQIDPPITDYRSASTQWDRDHKILMVCAENQTLTLTEDINVDIKVSKLTGSNVLFNEGSDLSGKGGTIAAGTTVNTYYIHGDNKKGSSSFVNQDGWVYFDPGVHIIGVQVKTSTLNGGDGNSDLGLGRLFDTSLVGLEFSNGDRIRIAQDGSGNYTALKVAQFHTAVQVDDIRIITTSQEIIEELGTLTILKFLDQDQDGEQDDGESLLSGWEFDVTGPGSFSTTVTTGEDGSISLEGLAFGDYTITETPLYPWSATTPNPMLATLSVGTPDVVVSVGNIPEPVTMGLLMIGGIGALLRRRRAAA